MSGSEYIHADLWSEHFFLLLGWWLLTSGDLILIPEELGRSKPDSVHKNANAGNHYMSKMQDINCKAALNEINVRSGVANLNHRASVQGVTTYEIYCLPIFHV